jgi:hypothetical protein
VLEVRIILSQDTFDRRANEFFPIESRGNDRNLHAKIVIDRPRGLR